MINGKVFKPLVILCLAALILLGGNKVSFASLKELPEVQKLSAEDFVKGTDVVDKDFEKERYLSLSFQIDKTWKETEFSTLRNTESFGRLAGTLVHYRGELIGDVHPYFQVIAEEIPREISAKNWLVTYVLDQGYTLRSLKEISEDKFEAMYVVTQGRDAFVVRSIGKKFGPRMIFAEYGVPTRAWERFMDYQTLTIKSFEVKGRDKAPIEKRSYYNYLQAIEFSYPKSWRIEKETSKEGNKLSVELISAREKQAVEGIISVDVFSTRSVKDLDDITIFSFDPLEEIKKVRARFDTSFKIEELLEKKTYALPEKVSYQVTDVYAVESIKNKYDTFEDGEDTHELWFSVFAYNNKYYVLTLVTPARTQNLYQWAVNSETFKELIESIQFE